MFIGAFSVQRKPMNKVQSFYLFLIQRYIYYSHGQLLLLNQQI